MNTNYFKAAVPFAAQAELKIDNLSGVIYGNYRGYDLTVSPTQGGKCFRLSFTVKRGSEMPSAVEMQQLAALHKSLFFGAVTDGYRVDFNVKSAGFGIANTFNKKLMPALSVAVSFLSSGGWQSCCQGCGKLQQSAVITYTIHLRFSAIPALNRLKTAKPSLCTKTSKRVKMLSAEL